MILNILKLGILFIILCNIPSYTLAYFGTTAGSAFSYFASLLLLAYFFLVREKHKLLIPFIFLGLSYFLISGINYKFIEEDFIIKEFIRFMIVIICAPEVLHRTKIKEIYWVIMLGALSIIINAFIFPSANINFSENYGRFSGFYLNPNFAGIICLVGMALTFAINDKRFRLIGQLIFTLAGLLTFSRTFVVIWLILSLFAIYKDRKNLVIPIIGGIVLLIIFTFSSSLTLNTTRFEALSSIFGTERTQVEVLSENSRSSTWALYYDLIMDRPFIGHGFMEFQIRQNGRPGVHNSYLMVIGEAGIIPFLLMIGIYAYLIRQSIKYFKLHPYFFFLTIVLVLALSTGHQYFFNFYNVFLAMYLFIELRKIPSNLYAPLAIKNEEIN